MNKWHSFPHILDCSGRPQYSWASKEYQNGHKKYAQNVVPACLKLLRQSNMLGMHSKR